ncbi:ABC-F family ATP-binding cassette domain-containing protein [Phreatobacter oligotrophus]|uniref:ABC-F family ATP-binding cassette domain-containing protein n=1 Tax=Phreatobacter oligotrophus TaxID=1122261 RepID=UPI002356F877|nr:ABC-F family ATP-binding cassette domain-containing protein [Phreatobacter oligotrophus]MBX9992435.1 ABC-F family ATP-binding cassette domain-containing protein [Phreatobacter oligotrophus]
MAPPLLQLQDIALTFGGTPLLTAAALSVEAGDRLALVGRNGSGKSTLLKIAAGLVEADSGSRFAQPTATIRYLLQEPDLSAYPTTLAYVESGLGPGDDPYRARMLLEELGLTGEEGTASLSGGEAKRAALAHAIAPEPDVLILDEPTNHLDLPAIEWLEKTLKRLPSAIVMISHDRRFLENLSRTTVWLDRGVTRRLEKGFAHFEAWRDEVLEQEEKEQHKLDRQIAREEHWLRYGVSARRKRNVRRLANLHTLRKDFREHRKAVGTVSISVSDADLSGKRIVEARGISKHFGDRAIVDNLTIRILRGDRLGIVGANGAGKTTLVKMLTGVLAPDSGSIELGTNLAMANLDQKRDELDPSMPLAEALTRGRGDYVTINSENRHVVGYMKDFLFAPEQKGTPLGVLSGGERGRLMLARALASPANLLVLDEPTNDLDLETLDLLQEMLTDFPGTVILVSHDRDFLDRVCTSVLVSEGAGRWIEYAGGYSDMVMQRGAGVSARTVEKPKAESAAAPAPRTEKPADQQRRKLSFKDKHDLDTLPARMEALQRDITKLQAILADPGLYTRDRAAFDKASAAMTKAQGELSAAEDRWLELEILKESLEA